MNLFSANMVVYKSFPSRGMDMDLSGHSTFQLSNYYMAINTSYRQCIYGSAIHIYKGSDWDSIEGHLQCPASVYR